MGRPRKNKKHLPPRMQEKRGVYYHTLFIDGKVKWIRLADNYADALRIWAEREGASQKTGSTANHMIDRYVLEILPKLALKTQDERTRQSKKLKQVFGPVLLSDIEPHHIAAYLDQRESKIAANREITFLSSMFSYAMRWGWCKFNPCTGVRRNTEKKRTRYITDEELKFLMSEASEQMACIIELAYLTAIRKSDLLKIRVNDLQADGLHVLPTKTQDSTGQVMIFSNTPRLLEVLNRSRKLRRRASSMYLFATQDGTPHSTSGFNSAWKRLKNKVGLSDIHFHDIRAKALTDAKRMAGSDYAQALGNHASVETTEIYIKTREVNTVRPLF
jgi:integrase